MEEGREDRNPESAFDSPTFNLDMSIHVDQPVGSMSISPCGRDVVLASRQGLHIIDLDSPYSPPRNIVHRTPWEVADVQWSPFAARDYWVISTSNQKALVWNLAMSGPLNHIEHVLHAHTRAITDINFSAHHPDILATCAVDSFVYSWDLRIPARPVMTFCDWFAGATQVKWNRQDPHILASSHNKLLRIWDDRKAAYPLKTIEAHETKIYGIDWNRVRPSSIVTCSLDKSIKFWDYEKAEDEPERVIRTAFPVWRARHTPFGWGLLAMPQQGNTDLHLYDRRLSEGMLKDDAIPAVHEFEGHLDQVKEFLWRPRGDITDGIDNREFQLVSWGTDQNLVLHRVEDPTLEKVGYEKGREVFKKFNLTRKNAAYKTFRDDQPLPDRSSQQRPSLGTRQEHAFSSALGGALSAGLNKAPTPPVTAADDIAHTVSTTNVRTRLSTKSPPNQPSAIEWMKGVKVGKQGPGVTHGRNSGDEPLGLLLPLLENGPGMMLEGPESLGDEITQAAEKYPRVNFEEVNMRKRTAAISVTGPWGEENAGVHVGMEVRFPVDYPEHRAPTIQLQRSPTIPDETLEGMAADLKTLALAYCTRRRGSLEALLCYLLGERSLKESITALESSMQPPDSAIGEQSSSEDEDDLGAASADQPQDMETSAAELLGTMNANANVPLPRTCGATFAGNGRLVSFFKPKKEKLPLHILDYRYSADGRHPGGYKVSGFGRLGNGIGSTGSDSDSEKTNDSDDYDSNGSSDSWDGLPAGSGFIRNSGNPSNRASNHLGYRMTSTNRSQPSVGLDSAGGTGTAPKYTASIYNLEDMLPSKKCLAMEYRIFGDGPEVCHHNALVAAKAGYLGLSYIWQLATLILYNDVPLEVMQQTYRREPILVIAKEATASRRKRRDSGLDLAFDEANPYAGKRLQARVKWGQHPLAGAWLIDELFKYFEQLADIQMLGMLSCVFSEPIDKGGFSNAIMDLSQHEIPMPIKSPGFSLDYFPSTEIAWSMFKPTISMPSTPKTSHTPLEVYGSQGSSNGVWGSDPITPFSTGTTPPLTYKTASRMSMDQLDPHEQSVSSSPERRHGRRSTSSLTSTFAAGLSRQFSNLASSSPPTGAGLLPKKRPSPVESMLGNLASGTGVTWGTNTVFSPAAVDITEAEEDEDADYEAAMYSNSESDDDDYYYLTPAVPVGDRGKTSVKVTMKNQHLFDGEGSATVPLLDPKQATRYKAYREDYANLLAVWGLETARLETLKFNGLPNYLPEAQHHPSTSSTSSVLPLGKRHSLTNASDSPPGLAIGPLHSPSAAADAVMRCSMCREVVRGTYAPCLACGHVLHTRCERRWFTGETGSGREECPTGCGCRCLEMSLAQPVITVDGDGDVPDPQNGAAGDLHPHLPPVLEDRGGGDVGVFSGFGTTSSEWEDVRFAGLQQRGLQHKSTSTSLARRVLNPSGTLQDWGRQRLNVNGQAGANARLADRGHRGSAAARDRDRERDKQREREDAALLKHLQREETW